ncbi:uncharacterized protein BJ171DRAFT_491813 [Polychytrium aggregatum]|uniref:uncharacterized protein n=1 Tax=Polychytrium aggregatum TaxID=110093 RepID=UPI0022FE4DF2|nr:uncharacterized protein BJ171DRAFT_491813 [Polychytrium aggregatum]KAI9207865.1 hypothetical protein BJ171DRAFT_491813 [Polychytrium aggregatum]
MALPIPSSTDAAQPLLSHHPDIFTIVCFNSSFQLTLSLATIKGLLLVCRRAEPLLSSKVARFRHWCRAAHLCHPEKMPLLRLTPCETISLSFHFNEAAAADLSWLADRAAQGSVAALYFLARILLSETEQEEETRRELKAIFVESSVSYPEQIFLLFRRAAEVGHPGASFHLAECYQSGFGVDQNHSKAFELYRHLADQGLTQAPQAKLGRCYESGEGVEQALDTAVEWYIQASDQGDVDTLLRIAFLRGWLAFLGHGVEQSDDNAFHHWQEVSTKSTDSDTKPIANYMLGWMHCLGRGTVQDRPEGTRIQRNNRSDKFPLSEEDALAGYDCFSNSSISRKFFKLCQYGSNRDWLCKHLMGVCLLHGFGVSKDWTKAADIFDQLANEGHSDSQYWIGQCYFQGCGVTRDLLAAFQWWSRSADRGNSNGLWMVGGCYFRGWGVTKDYTKAVEWFRRSAEQGNWRGQFWLGWCHRHGIGAPKNITATAYWIQKAADQGFELAITGLKHLKVTPHKGPPIR